MPLFRRREPKRLPAQHAVITHLPLSDVEFGTEEDRDAVHALASDIEATVAEVGGEYDGDEFGGGEALLFVYGPDADELFTRIERCLEGFSIRAGAYAIKRYGAADDPDAREERVELT